MKAPPRIAEAARKRVDAALGQIQHSVAVIKDGRPGDAETDASRREQVYQARTGIPLAEARRMVTRPGEGKERRFGKTVDFVDVAFFERGMQAARAVARIITKDGQGFGTGFLISPRLLITNNHVIATKADAASVLAEFDYARDISGSALRVTRYSLAPELCFLTNHEDELDYTVVALGGRVSGEKSLAQFGFIPVSNARNKHQLGDFVNIIQHPDGRMKEAVLRENQLVARAGTALHYLADTEEGASGSPVLNVQFALVALHHWGSPHRELHDENGNPIPKSVNEGIRASSIYTDLTTLRDGLSPAAKAYIDEALQLGLETSPTAPRAPESTATPGGMSTPVSAVRVDADGTAVWNIPLTVAINLGGQFVHGAPATAVAHQPVAEPAGGAEPGGREVKLQLDPDYSKRDGYQPAFLEDVIVPLPKLSTEQKRIAAKNRTARASDDPHELKYHHYSVVMNGERRLAFFSAVNINGAEAKDFNRTKGIVSDPFEDEDGGSEATELWFPEERILEDQQTPPDFYREQTAFDAQGNEITDRRSGGHLRRMFQQGHLTRRQDPLWGDDDLIPFANGDTFHVTNCAPQVGFFNMGFFKPAESLAAEARRPAKKAKKAKKAAAHPGGELHWRALEDYVLNNARAKREKVSVFTGPIFDDDEDFDWDRGREDMEGFKVPREFWKLILRIEDGALQATALVADQAPLIDYLPEFIRRGEAASRGLPYEKVKKYHVSMRELARRTKFTFDAEVMSADTYRRSGNAEAREVESIEDISLLRARPAAKNSAAKKAVAKKAKKTKKAAAKKGAANG
jgi:endonuclease G, mitochondrial